MPQNQSSTGMLTNYKFRGMLAKCQNRLLIVYPHFRIHLLQNFIEKDSPFQNCKFLKKNWTLKILDTEIYSCLDNELPTNASFPVKLYLYSRVN